MQLQAALDTFQQAGITVFAISYDPVSVLAAFAAARGITYSLLSDGGSKVMEDLGLLNQHIEAQQRAANVPVREQHLRTPYPGTFLLNEDGIIERKDFEQSYRVRCDASTLAEELTGKAGPDLAATGNGPVTLRVRTDSSLYQPYMKQRLIVDLDIAEPFHIYGEPIPEGYTSLRVTLDPVDSLVLDQLQAPQAHPFQVEGIDEEFVVHERSVRAVLPFHVTKDLGDVTFTARIAYQACSNTLCLPPVEHVVEIPLSGRPLIRD